MKEEFKLTDEEEAVIKAVMKRHFKIMLNDFWYDDLFSLGMYATWKARKTYDGSKGVKYTTYLWQLAFNSMYDFKKRHVDKYKDIELLSIDYELSGEAMNDKFTWLLEFTDKEVDTMIQFYEWCKELKPRQKFIVDEMVKGTPQKDIAKEIGVSAERIRQDRLAMKDSFNEYVV